MISCKIVTLIVTVTICNAVSLQAPGDEDPECLTSPDRPSTVNQEILMASFNYANLLERDGGPWIVVNEREINDPMSAGNATTVN